MQPALSQRIRMLENEVGTPLFERPQAYGADACGHMAFLASFFEVVAELAGK